MDSPSHPSEGLPWNSFGEAKHPNVVTSIAMDPHHGNRVDDVPGRMPAQVGVRARLPARVRSPAARRGTDLLRLGLGFSRAASSARGGSGPRAGARAVRGAVRVGTRGVRGHRRWTRLAFDAGAPCGVDDRESCDAAGSETRGELCRWLAHDNGATRSVTARPADASRAPARDRSWRKWNTTPSAAAAANVEANGVRSTGTAPRGVQAPRTRRRGGGAPPRKPRASRSRRARRNRAGRDMPKLSDAPGAAGVAPGVDLAGSSTISCARARRRMTRRTTRRGERRVIRQDARRRRWRRRLDRGEGGGGGAENRAARGVVRGDGAHGVARGHQRGRHAQILCDGANNIAPMYDYSEDPDGDGDV